MSERNIYYTVCKLEEEVTTDKDKAVLLAQDLAGDQQGERFAVVRVIDVFEGKHISEDVVRQIRDKSVLLDEPGVRNVNA